ncbi:MAG TPA: hypothetical protein VM266_14590, partial [Solirubrobacteraceae bacterium]|nr:hypothetical protein [Solirubrobacteraceae bacterium]
MSETSETGAPGAKAPAPTPATETKTPSLGPWHAATILILALALVAITALVLGNVENQADSATGVLGVIVPVFASVGAAVFGVSVAYNAGKASGEESGTAKGAAAGEEKAKRDIAGTLLDDLQTAGTGFETLRRTLRTVGTSEPHRDTLLFAAPDRTDVPPLAVQGEEL